MTAKPFFWQKNSVSLSCLKLLAMRKNLCLLLVLFFFFSIDSSAQRVVNLTTENGLSSSLVNCLFQDSRGDIWIGTENGLNRYDGLKVDTFRSNPSDPNSLAHNIVRSILEDNDGHLFIGTQDGVQLFNRRDRNFSHPLSFSDGTPYSGSVGTLLLRNNGEVWLYAGGLIRIAFSGEECFLERVDREIPAAFLTGEMLEDSDGHIWMCAAGSRVFRLNPDGTTDTFQTDIARGWNRKMVRGYDGNIYLADSKGNVCHFDPASGSFVRDEIPQLNGSRINALHFSADRKLFISTDDKGSYLYDPQQGASPVTQSGLPYDPAGQKIHALITDTDGNIWMGVYQKGVLMMPAEVNRFSYVGSRYSGLDLIGSCCVTSLMVDRDQSIWVGTDNDGIYVMNRQRRFLRHFSKEMGVPGTVFDLTQDSSGTVWFGSYIHGFWSIDPSTGKLLSCDAMGSPDSDTESVYAIAEDSRGRIWMGTMGSGLHYFDKNSSRTVRPDLEGLNNWIDDILILDDNTAYVASYYGLYRLDISGDVPSLKESMLQGKVVYSLAADDGYLYCCTSEGLYLVDMKDSAIHSYTTEDGLGDNMLMSIRITEPGKAWISTSMGLTFFDREKESFTNYYADDGLHVTEFSPNSSTAYKDGMLMFGGSEGVVYFEPSQVKEIRRTLHVKITDVTVSDRVVEPDGGNRYTLNYNDGSCTVSFAAKEYSAPSGIIFKYSTDSKNWNTLARGQSSVALSNLRPGRYILSVKIVDKDDESEPVTISVRVKHPWWSSAGMLVLYSLVSICLTLMICILFRRHRRDEEEIENHRRLEASNEEKVKFFVNLSHELRSPMTLIEGPLQELIRTDSDPERTYKYSVMNKSIRRMHLVIDQILDFRKIEKGHMTFSFAPVNIVGYLACITDLFKEQAQSKGIELTYSHKVPDGLTLWIDANYFDKVIINLLSNALKFTPSGGAVSLSLSVDGPVARMEVLDNGVGIPDDDLDRIFDRFYQSENAVSGTGIGLNLAKLITGLHHGTISAAHNPAGQGSLFTVTIPLGDSHLSEGEKCAAQAGTAAAPVGLQDVTLPPVQPDGGAGTEAKPAACHTIIIAEDNEDICAYLQRELSFRYNVVVCGNGKDAYNLVLTKSPDLVIADVMMPGMDGFSLCRKIKKNPNVSFLPVIILSARTQDNDKVEGLAAGADAYLTKPFNLEVLRQTIESLITGRESLKISLSEAKVKASDIRDVDVKTPDDRLLERVVKVINENLSNPSLTADEVAQEVGISRVHLYRKLKELTDQTPRDFIKNIRLKKAAEMLSEKKHSISELAEAVGYSSPSSFATVFKELYGQTPTEYMNTRK